MNLKIWYFSRFFDISHIHIRQNLIWIQKVKDGNLRTRHTHGEHANSTRETGIQTRNLLAVRWWCYPPNHRDAFIKNARPKYFSTFCSYTQQCLLLKVFVWYKVTWDNVYYDLALYRQIIDWPVQTAAAWWSPPLHLPPGPGSGLQPSSQGSLHSPHLRSDQVSTLHSWLQSASGSAETNRGFVINDRSLLTMNYWIVVLITH